MRHLRPFWDVHRFRIAPQVEAVLDRCLAEGTLVLKSASLVAATRRGDEMLITLRDRQSGAVEAQSFDAVLIATGPAHGGILASQPLLASLADLGRIRADTAGLGLETSSDGRAVAASGAPADDLLIAGPLARGTFGELMGLPEVAIYARFIAERAAAWRRHPTAASLTQRAR